MPITGKEMLKLFHKAGWKVLRTKGSHVIIGKKIMKEKLSRCTKN